MGLPGGVVRAVDTATADAATDKSDEVVRFGPFTLRPAQRVLMEGDARVALGSRAFDILLQLLEHAGSFVTKYEIFRRVWANTVVVVARLTRIEFANADALMAYSGLDPRPCASAQRRGRRRLSARGSPSLRRQL